MAISEFNLITRYFTRPAQNPLISLGNGDDCALFRPGDGMQLAISSDMLVSGRHFFPDADPFYLGHKSLAVNLSDLAAMGAKPLAFTLSLALPDTNEAWLSRFSEGLFALANKYHCDLIGGDTTKGPLTISITILGEVPLEQALRRDNAKAGDDIWVSGTLGDARLALAAYQHEVQLHQDAHQIAAKRMHQPEPRVTLGQALRTFAHTAIDISDGLIGDLQHILNKSHIGATINVDNLPVGEILSQQSQVLQRQYALSGGDDYEICFTASQEHHAAILAISQQTGTPVTCIGQIDAAPGLRFIDQHKTPLDLHYTSFDHFSNT